MAAHIRTTLTGLTGFASRLRTVPPYPLAAGLIVAWMLVTLLVRGERATRLRLAHAPLHIALADDLWLVAFSIIFLILAIAATLAVGFVFREGGSVWHALRRRRVQVVAFVVTLLVEIALLLALDSALFPESFSHLGTTVSLAAQFSAGLAIVSIVMWLGLRDTLRGLVEYSGIGILVVVCGVAAVVLWFSSTILVYYLSERWLLGLSLALTITIAWLKLPQLPMFFAVLPYLATFPTIPWLGQWLVLAGFLMFVFLLGAWAGPDDVSPGILRWVRRLQPVVWLAYLTLIGSQWGLWSL